MNEPNRRQRQIANAIREELVTITRKDLSDPHLEKVGFITFSGIDLSDDLRSATVWVAFMGKEEKNKDVQAALGALNRSSKFIHRLLIKRLPMKLHPIPTFRFDNGFDRAAVVGKALQEASEIEKETKRQRELQESEESSEDKGNQ
jgi:ribosome-binding factor A